MMIYASFVLPYLSANLLVSFETTSDYYITDFWV